MIPHRTNLDNHFAVVLHSNHYQNSSLIVNVFLRDHGKVSAIVRGARGKKVKDNPLFLLQPFQNIIVSLTGKQELLVLKNIEATEKHWNLSGKALYCAYYINELLLRLLPSYTDCSDIFLLYNKTLGLLGADSTHFEAPLRVFELKLLEFLGYGLNLDYAIDSEQPIDADKTYYYRIGSGASEKKDFSTDCLPISGKTLLDLAQNQLSAVKTLQQSKLLLKWALAEHLGSKPLKSREIFKQLYAAH